MFVIFGSSNSRVKHKNNTKFRIHSEIEPQYEWRVTSNPVMYAFCDITSSYTWCPKSDHLIYVVSGLAKPNTFIPVPRLFPPPEFENPSSKVHVVG